MGPILEIPWIFIVIDFFEIVSKNGLAYYLAINDHFCKNFRFIIGYILTKFKINYILLELSLTF